MMLGSQLEAPSQIPNVLLRHNLFVTNSLRLGMISNPLHTHIYIHICLSVYIQMCICMCMHIYIYVMIWHMRAFNNQGPKHTPQLVGLFIIRAPTKRANQFIEEPAVLVTTYAHALASRAQVLEGACHLGNVSRAQMRSPLVALISLAVWNMPKRKFSKIRGPFWGVL